MSLVLTYLGCLASSRMPSHPLPPTPPQLLPTTPDQGLFLVQKDDGDHIPTKVPNFMNQKHGNTFVQGLSSYEQPCHWVA